MKNFKFVSALLASLFIASSIAAAVPANVVFADEADADADAVVETTVDEEVAEEDETEAVPEEVETVDEEIAEEIFEVEAEEYEAPAMAKTQVEMFVDRVYQVTLGRGADQGGLAYWSGELTSKRATGISIVYSFFVSDEFVNKRYDNRQYVECLYQAFFGRASDASGMNYWLGKFNAGATRDQIFSGFANSDEFFNLCNSYGIVSGSYMPGKPVQQVAQTNLFVNRLYTTILGRGCDRSGLEYWTAALVNRQLDGASVSYNIIFSDEYRNKNKSNTAYIQDLYLAIMGRGADNGGLNYWNSWLNEAAADVDVFNGFIVSDEFTSICAQYGISRGNALDKFALNRIMARANHEAPQWLYCVNYGSTNFTDRVRFSVFGEFYGSFTVIYYRDGNLLAEPYTYNARHYSDSYGYVDFDDAYVAWGLLPAGTYSAYIYSSLGYVLDRSIVTVTKNYDLIENGESAFFNWDYQITWSHTWFDMWDGCGTHGNHGYLTDGIYGSTCNRMSAVIGVEEDCGSVRYTWLYSANGTWAGARSVSSGTATVQRGYDNGYFYYYEMPYSSQATNIPRGAYWCLITATNGEYIGIIRCYHC